MMVRTYLCGWIEKARSGECAPPLEYGCLFIFSFAPPDEYEGSIRAVQAAAIRSRRPRTLTECRNPSRVIGVVWVYSSDAIRLVVFYAPFSMLTCRIRSFGGRISDASTPFEALLAMSGADIYFQDMRQAMARIPVAL